jgi:hypothetical protein
LCKKLERVAFKADHFERSEKYVFKQISPFAQKSPLFFLSDTIKPDGAATARRRAVIGIFSFLSFYLPSGVVFVSILC